MTTQTIAAGQTATISIASPETISIRSTAGSVSILVTRTGAGTDLITRTAPFVFQAGPYQQSATVEVTCLAGTVTFVSPESATVSTTELASPENDGLMTAEYAAALEEITARSGDYVLVAVADAVKLSGVQAGATRNQTDAWLTDLANAKGTLQANNIVFADGSTLEAVVQELRQGTSNPASAPTIDTAPTFDDTTPAVGQSLTITPGDVTEASGRTSTATYRINIPGEPEGAWVTSTTYVVPTVAFGKGISVTQRQTDDAIPTLFAERTSAVTTAVSGTKPTNSVAPSISPNGSQAVGQTHTVSTGTWTGASTYGVQFYLAGSPVGARSSTLTFTTADNQVGLALTFDVIAYSSLGVASDPVAGSNSVTITGTTPAVVNVSPPAWPATIYLDSPADFTPGTWTGDIRGTQSATDEGREWRFFRNSETTPYLAIVNTLSIHTPRAPAIVGDTLYIEETVFDATTGQAYPVARSAGKTITATPADFAANLTSAGTAGYSWTINTAIAQSTVATLTGGTAPYSITSHTSAASGVTASISGSNVVLSGTPTALASLTSGTINFADSAGATASVSYSYSVAAASGSALSALPYSEAAVAISGANTSYNGTTNKTYNGVVVLGPNGDGRNRHRLVQGAPSIAGGVRNELLWFDYHLIEGSAVWLAYDLLWDIANEFPASTSSYDEHLVMQTHTPYSGDTQPGFACKLSRQSGQIYFRIAGTANAPSGGTSTTTNNPANFGHQTLVQGQRYRFIIKHRAGWLASHNPRIDIWVRNGSATTWTQLVTNYANYPNVHNHGGDTSKREYVRIGGYKWSSSVWANTPISWVSSPLFYGVGEDLFQDAANALLTLG